MKILAVANQKGGATKSTVSIQLCRWLSLKELRVCLVDADGQQSSSIWADAMPSDLQPDGIEIINDANALVEQIPELAKDYDWIVIDCPGAIEETTRAAMLRADGVLVPVVPAGLDLRSSADATRLLKQARSVRGGLPEAVLFLSRARKGTKSKEQAMELIRKLGFPVTQTAIHQRDIVTRLFGQHTTIFDAKGRDATDIAREFDNLFKEIFDLWQLKI